MSSWVIVTALLILVAVGPLIWILLGWAEAELRQLEADPFAPARPWWRR